jgi:hypothetical protein
VRFPREVFAENEWQMSFNTDKCFIIAAGTKNTKINYEYKIHNQYLEKVPHSKYLGVTLSKDLSWKPHINGFPLECVEQVGNTSWLSRFVVVEDKTSAPPLYLF